LQHWVSPSILTPWKLSAESSTAGKISLLGQQQIRLKSFRTSIEPQLLMLSRT
jgi:hypothetical protein